MARGGESSVVPKKDTLRISFCKDEYRFMLFMVRQPGWDPTRPRRTRTVLEDERGK